LHNTTRYRISVYEHLACIQVKLIVYEHLACIQVKLILNLFQSSDKKDLPASSEASRNRNHILYYTNLPRVISTRE